MRAAGPAHGIGTILRVPGDANGVPAQAFDLVMPALGLHVDPGTGCQAVGIHQFSRAHVLNDAQRVVSVAAAFKEWRPSPSGHDFEASLLLLLRNFICDPLDSGRYAAGFSSISHQLVAALPGLTLEFLPHIAFRGSASRLDGLPPRAKFLSRMAPPTGQDAHN